MANETNDAFDGVDAIPKAQGDDCFYTNAQ